MSPASPAPITVTSAKCAVHAVSASFELLVRGHRALARPMKLMKGKLKLSLWIFGIAALIAAATYFNVQELLRRTLAWIESLSAWGSMAFIFLYILATVLFLPGSILTLGAGLLFGVVLGFVYVSIASTVGATAAFLIGRYLARDWVARKIEGNTTFQAIDDAVGEGGWRIVGLTRLSPIFPFNMLNYAFGLTHVSLRDYFFASWIGMMPGTVMYVYLGSVAGSLAALGSGARARTPGEWALYAVGLLATAVVTLYVTRKARGALKQRIRA